MTITEIGEKLKRHEQVSTAEVTGAQLFMLLHDIRELLLNDPSYFKGENSFNLIKNNFPLIMKKDDISDFNINEEYDLEQINPTKIFRKEVLYKLKKEDNFDEGELILFNKHIYFGNIVEDKKIKINLKFKLKAIGLYKSKEDKNDIINILVQNCVKMKIKINIL